MDYVVQAYRPATMECVLASAVARNIPANLLLAIGQHEAGKEGSAIRNSNGSYDLGRAGINTTHLAELVANGVNRDVAVFYLKNDGCYNYDMAAFLIQRHLAQCKTTFWRCAANYHSKTAYYNQIYQSKIIPLAISWQRYLSAHYRVKDITQ